MSACRVTNQNNLFLKEVREKLENWNEKNRHCDCSAEGRAGKFESMLDCQANGAKTCAYENLPNVDNTMCAFSRHKRDIHQSHAVNPDENLTPTDDVRTCLNVIYVP